jgi:hypothetical protein
MKQQMGNENFQVNQAASKGHVDQFKCFSKFSKAEPLCWEPTGIIVSHLDIVSCVPKPPLYKIPCYRETYILLGNFSQNILIKKGEYLKLSIWKQHDIMGHLTVVGHLTFICPFVIN